VPEDFGLNDIEDVEVQAPVENSAEEGRGDRSWYLAGTLTLATGAIGFIWADDDRYPDRYHLGDPIDAFDDQNLVPRESVMAEPGWERIA
jgi:hypothetical protein